MKWIAYVAVALVIVSLAIIGGQRGGADRVAHEVVAAVRGIAAQEGASGGELFGYRIGATYPVSAKTELWQVPASYGQYSGKTYFLRAEAAVKPPDVGPVHLLVTQRTFTILAISSSTLLKSGAEAIEFSGRYTDVLTARYGRRPDHKYENGGSSFEFAHKGQPGFYLFNSLGWCQWSPISDENAVHIGVTFWNNPKLWDQAVMESYEAQRRASEKSGSGRGL